MLRIFKLLQTNFYVVCQLLTCRVFKQFFEVGSIQILTDQLVEIVVEEE